MEREGTRALGTRAPISFSAILIQRAHPLALVGAAARGRAYRTPVRPRSRRRHEVRRLRAREARARTSGRLRELGRTGATGPTLSSRARRLQGVPDEGEGQTATPYGEQPGWSP